MDMKEMVKEKLAKREGFTLVELLVVVAIVAIMIAISIPLVTGALDKADEATNDANVRAAIAEADIQFLTDDNPAISSGMAYDASNGKLVDSTSSSTVPTYGKGNYDGFDYSGKIVWVKIDTGTGDTTTDPLIQWAWGENTSAPSDWKTGIPVDKS